MAATGVVTTAGIVGTMSATESGADFTDGYTYPEYVEPSGYYAGWIGFVTDGPLTGGGGPGNAVSIQRRKPRGWANERAQFELSQEVQRAQATLAQSPVKAANKVARKLADYTNDIVDLYQLQQSVARLTAEHQNKIEKDRDLREAAQVMTQFLQDEQDAIDLLVALDQFDACCVIAVTAEPLVIR